MDPGNLEYVQALIDALHKKFGSSKKIGPMAMFKERGARMALKKAMSDSDWDEAIRSGLTNLQVNPWDVPTLTALAAACGKIVDREGRSAIVTYGDCELYYLKCAFDTAPRDKPDPVVRRQIDEALEKRKRLVGGLGPSRPFAPAAATGNASITPRRNRGPGQGTSRTSSANSLKTPRRLSRRARDGAG